MILYVLTKEVIAEVHSKLLFFGYLRSRVRITAPESRCGEAIEMRLISGTMSPPASIWT